MAKSDEVLDLEEKLDAVLAALLRESGGSRSTLRIDDRAREWNVNFVCAEALANVAKHAGASRVSVAVTLEGDAVKASIVDDGRGGAPSSPDGRVRGSGLDGLVDRVEALNGRLVIESHEGRGTALHLWIPEAITASGSTA